MYQSLRHEVDENMSAISFNSHSFGWVNVSTSSVYGLEFIRMSESIKHSL